MYPEASSPRVPTNHRSMATDNDSTVSGNTSGHAFLLAEWQLVAMLSWDDLKKPLSARLRGLPLKIDAVCIDHFYSEEPHPEVLH